MGRGVLKWSLIVITLMTLSVLASVMLATTSLLTPAVQWAGKKWYSPEFTVENVRYTFPWQLELDNIKLDKKAPTIKHVAMWLSQTQDSLPIVTLDSVLIQGISSQTLPHFPTATPIEVKQISFADVNIIRPQWRVDNLALQISHPVWRKSHTQLESADIELYSEKAYWHGINVSDVLVSGKYGKDSQPFNLSASWNNNALTASGRWQSAEGLHLDNLTLHGLTLSEELFKQWATIQTADSPLRIEAIDRLDITAIDGPLTSDLRINNADISARNLTFSASSSISQWLWQQNNAQLSFNADSFQIGEDANLIQPIANISLSANDISVENMNAELWQGAFSTSLNITPDSLNIARFTFNGAKWILEQAPTTLYSLGKYLDFPNITVDQLDVRNGQLIQLTEQPFWQLSGVNWHMENAIVRQETNWGLWAGDISLSSGNLSYDTTVATQGIIELNTTPQGVDLSRLFIPFEAGYLSAQGNWNYNETGKPWKLNVETDGMPAELVKSWIFPLGMDGVIDSNTTLSGLSGDREVLLHTITGNSVMSVRDGTLLVPLQHHTVVQPFTLENLNITADRGIISIAKTPLSGQGLNAEITEQKGKDIDKSDWLTLEYSDSCNHVETNLLTAVINESNPECY